MNKYLKYTLFLLVLGLLAGLLLSFVNSFTYKIIREADQKAAREALEEYYPFANYKEVTANYSDLDKNIEKVYFAYTTDNKIAAVIYQTSVKGYADQVITLIAIEPDGTIINAIVTAQKETKGKGDKYMESGFDFKVATEKVDSYDYELIAGATVTGEAAGSGIDSAVKHFKTIKDQIGAETYE